MNMAENNVAKVFLGGSCNPTTWRKDVAIPLLEAKEITYYNPQVDEWSEELIEIEANAKEQAEILLFVIDNKTRAITSMLEATENISRGRKVSLVVLPCDEMIVNGNKLEGSELKDLSRSRKYLIDIANRHKCPVYNGVEDAINAME